MRVRLRQFVDAVLDDVFSHPVMIGLCVLLAIGAGRRLGPAATGWRYWLDAASLVVVVAIAVRRLREYLREPPSGGGSR